ncbi:MAG: phasin family protein [Asticcacaulis sp.]
MENGAEAIKTSVERMTAASNQAFRDGVEKSLAGLNEMNALSKGNVEALVESVTAATKGAEALGAQAVSYSKKAWEDQVNAAKALSTAKSLQEVVELQTQFAKSALETYVAEMNRVSETLQGTMKDTFKPLNARMTATVERFQSAR